MSMVSRHFEGGGCVSLFCWKSKRGSPACACDCIAEPGGLLHPVNEILVGGGVEKRKGRYFYYDVK
jgi:hypothetical protein